MSVLWRGPAIAQAIERYDAVRLIRPTGLKIIFRQSRMLRNAYEHSRTDFIAIVKSKHEVGPAGTLQGAVRPALPFDGPANPQQRGQHSFGFYGWPAAHA